MRPNRLLVIAIVLLQLFAAPSAALARGWSRTVSNSIEGNAGGWGFATPLMIAGVGVYQHLKGVDDFEAGDLLNRKVLGGLAGDFATVAIFNAIAPAIPGGALIRNYFVMFGGFLGWELGSGNIGEADWVSIGTQAAVATLIQSGIHALALAGGLSLGPIPIAILSIAGAITADILLDKLRGEPEADAEDRAFAPSPSLADGDAEATPSAPSDGADRDRKEEYRRLIESLNGVDRTAQRAALEAYEEAR